MSPPMARLRQRLDVNVSCDTVSEGNLHPLDIDEQRAVKGTSPYKRDDVSHVDPQLIEVAPHAVPAFDFRNACRLSEAQVREHHDGLMITILIRNTSPPWTVRAERVS